MASVAGNSAAIASVVFRPLPVMQTTVVSLAAMRPWLNSFWVTPVVTPPAVSVKMPSVSASSLMASTISGSETSSAQPPLSRISLHGEGAVGRIADGQRSRDGVRFLRLEAREVTLDAVGNGRTAGGLRAEKFHGLFFDPAERDEFLESFRDFCDQRATGHRHHDVVRQAPAKLLGDFVTVGLRAF